jgi:hypothetical protein
MNSDRYLLYVENPPSNNCGTWKYRGRQNKQRSIERVIDCWVVAFYIYHQLSTVLRIVKENRTNHALLYDERNYVVQTAKYCLG